MAELRNCPMRALAWASGSAWLDPLLPIGIGLDEARIDRKSLPSDQSFLDAAAQHALENATKEIALPEAAMPVLGEC